MFKIAAATIMAETIFDVGYTFFCLVLRIGCVVLSQFMIPMSEFALLFIRTISEFSEFFAKL